MTENTLSKVPEAECEVSFIAETTVDGRDIICRVLLVCGLEVIASFLGIGGRISFIAGAANIVVFEEADLDPVGTSRCRTKHYI